jgi:hypothetical protein
MLAVAILAILSVTPLPALAQPAGKRFAVLVGVNEYNHPKLVRLKYAEADMQELADELRPSGYKITLLTTSSKDPALAPTKANIDRAVQAALSACTKGDSILIAMAGHGVQFEGQKDSYFCPVDAKPFPDESKTLFSLGGLYASFDKSNAGVKVVLVDACRDDPVGGRGIDADTAPKPPSGVAALFSCRAGERAFEHDKYKHGVFFHHVLKGLRGEAADKKGRVTFASLAGYVTSEVSEVVPDLIGNGARQSPNLKADYSNEPIIIPPSTGPVWRNLIPAVGLAGWVSDSKSSWTNTGGVIRGEVRGSLGMLATEAEYRDFELELEYRLTAMANSGVFLRADRETLSGDDNVEIQIMDDSAFPKESVAAKTGAVYKRASRLASVDAPAGQWNRMAIRVSGDRITTRVNDVLVMDSEISWPAATGKIGLQAHPSGSIEFRSIKVRETPPVQSRARLDPITSGQIEKWQKIGNVEWNTKNGVVSPTPNSKGWLASPDDFTDFELDFDYSLRSGGNSGVFLHAWTSGGQEPRFISGADFVELQLADDAAIANNPSFTKTGALYRRTAPNPAPLAPAGQSWHHVHLSVVGKRVRASINGLACLDADVEWPRASGRIGFQSYGGELHFRRIRIRDLSKQ